MRKNIPNFITLINLYCGCAALACIFYEQFVLAFWLLLAGGIADFLDGMVARLLNVSSPMGKELDSLADMVSFGAVPGAIFYMLIQKSLSPESAGSFSLIASSGFLVTIFACLRLAKFNIDTNQSKNFIGLPTPSCTIFSVGLMLVYDLNSFNLQSLILNPYFLFPSLLLISFIMLAKLEMFSFKFDSFKWEGNEIKFIFAALSILLIVFLRELAFSIIVLLYILIALGQKVAGKTSTNS